MNYRQRKKLAKKKYAKWAEDLIKESLQCVGKLDKGNCLVFSIWAGLPKREEFVLGKELFFIEYLAKVGQIRRVMDKISAKSGVPYIIIPNESASGNITIREIDEVIEYLKKCKAEREDKTQ